MFPLPVFSLLSNKQRVTSLSSIFFFFFFFETTQPIIVKFAIFSDLVDKKNFPPKEREVKYCSGLVVSIPFSTA